MEQLNADMKKMGDDLRSEMTKIIDNLTSSAISKIEDHMTSQLNAMNTNVNTIIAQVNQAFAEMMAVYHASGPQRYGIPTQSPGVYQQYLQNQLGTQYFPNQTHNASLGKDKTEIPKSWEDLK
eukprot:9610854-Ditylum_brightwellii.AAC.1